MSPEAPAAGGDAFVCPVCGEVFALEAYRDLHLGRAHPGELAPDQEVAFEEALEAERAWLERYRKHVRGGLFTLPAAFLGLFTALVVLVAGAPPIFLLISLPIMLILASFFYVMGYVYDPSEGSVSDLRQHGPPPGGSP